MLCELGSVAISDGLSHVRSEWCEAQLEPSSSGFCAFIGFLAVDDFAGHAFDSDKQCGLVVMEGHKIGFPMSGRVALPNAVGSLVD